jgi:hypothetical protein
MGSKSMGGKLFEDKRRLFHSMGNHFLWGIFIATSLGAWTALAQPRLTAFFIENEPSIQDSVESVKTELMEALSKSSEVELLPIPRAMKLVDLIVLPVVSNMLREAYEAMEKKHFSEARALFKKAIELALRQPERANFGQIFDAHMAWVVASVQDGDEDEARAILRTLAKLAPNYALPKELPPVFQREFERAKLLANRLPKGSISIESPEGAVVFLNGQPVGISPLLVSNLPRGTHYVSMEDGNQFDMRFGQVVELQSAHAQVRGAFSKITIRLPAGFVADPVLTPYLDLEALERLVFLAREMDAAFVLVGFVKELEPNHFHLSLTLFHAQKKRFLSLSPVGFSKSLVGKAFLGKRISDAVLQSLRSADKETAATATLPLDWRAVRSEESSFLKN